MMRPEVCTSEMLVYLDGLKATGRNMFGATALVEYAFSLTPHEASSVVQYWLATCATDGAR